MDGIGQLLLYNEQPPKSQWQATIRNLFLLMHLWFEWIHSDPNDSFFFFQPHLWHMEIPKPGIKSKLQLQPSLGQHWILNSLCWGWGQGSKQHCHRDNARSLTHWATAGTPKWFMSNLLEQRFLRFLFFFFPYRFSLVTVLHWGISTPV